MSAIVALEIDGTVSSSFLADERSQAIADILAVNDFKYLKATGPYKILLSLQDGYLTFQFKNNEDQSLPLLALSPRPYKKLIQDYFLMVESYEKTRVENNPYKLEAVDMARRGIHNEGARLLTERLAGKIEMDFETARRFFTLICVLHLGSGNGHRLLVG